MADLAFKRMPTLGACGLDCGLCPRYHTAGPSRCPGCAAETYNGPGCSLQRCCVRIHRLESCAQCADSGGCPKLERVLAQSGKGDSFISYLPVPQNLEAVHRFGIEPFARLQDERVAFLEFLIHDHDDGRSKGFYCLSVQLLPLAELRAAVEAAGSELSMTSSVKDRAAALRQAFNGLASRHGLTLKLRRA